MRWIWAILALTLSASLSVSGARASVDAFIDTGWPASGAPGMAFAIVDGDTIESGARGTKWLGADKPVSPDTPFLIGSITKSFTALAIMQLVEAGTVELDAGIGDYLDNFAARPSGKITIRQLLAHTSGYSTVQGNKGYENAGNGPSALGDHVAQIALWQPAYAPGERWEYSNANYRVLGALIEAMSGKSYAQYIEEEILAPVGMAHSFVSDGSPPGDVAIGHRPWFTGKRAFQTARTDAINAPAGGVFASANDLARYLQMMMNGKDDILSASGKAQMMQPASAQSPFYGFGWFLDVRRGTASHTGLVPGTETLAIMLPAQRKAAAVLVNANGGIGFGENLELRNGLSALALGLEYSGEGSRIWQKLTYLMVMALPVLFVLAMVFAWLNRAKLAARTGAMGRFSLWFPLAAMAAMAFALICLIPPAFGGNFGTLQLYQPDFALAMAGAAILGPLWALVRLAIAYRARCRPRAETQA